MNEALSAGAEPLRGVLNWAVGVGALLKAFHEWRELGSASLVFVNGAR